MTRKLESTQHKVLLFMVFNCKTNVGIVVREIRNTKDNTSIEALKDRIVGRFTLNPILDLAGNKLAGADEIITTEIAEQIEMRKLKKLKYEVHYTVKQNALCQKCFGIDLSTNKRCLQPAIGVMLLSINW